MTSDKLVALIGIVDDDASVRESISSLLRSVGYRSMTFASAEAFLDMNHGWRADCLLLDVKMPGLSGLDLQKRLIESGNSIPIVFITGHGDDGARAKALRRGAVAFLDKPFTDKDLLGAIESALEAPRV
jgi:FixJ family two-component response regulator